MANVTIKQAMALTGKSDSTLRRDMRAGKVSYTKDDKGKVLFDTAELARAYGKLNQTDIPNEQSVNGHDTPGEKDKVVQLLENQVADLKGQLEKAEERETTLIKEKARLLDMYTEERAERRALQPPPENQKKQLNWWQRMVGVR